MRVKAHLPCPDCGSSDGLTDYTSHTFCFVCRKRTQEEEKELNEEFQSKVNTPKRLQPLLEDYRELTDRGLSRETAEKYKVFKHPDSFYGFAFPQFRNGVHVANKMRLAGDRKGFAVDGEFNKSELFGQHIFPPGSAKTITICEGYEDAMAAFEMQGSKYPVVSVHSASTARKDCADAYEYLNSFDEIVLVFDKDEGKKMPDGSERFPGQEAAREVAALFPPKKVRIVTLQRGKDANDYLKAGLGKEFVQEWWRGPVFTPQGLRFGSELWDEIVDRKTTESVEYPWNGFNELTYGMRLGELVILTADTGVGKTSVLKEIEHYLLNHSQYGIGILHLEETNADTGLGLMSIEASKPLHLPDIRESVSTEEMKKYYDKTINTDRVVLYDHFGSNDINDLLNKIRHMSSMGCKYIILDHLSIVVSDQSGDERKQLDEIATRLKTLTVELQICVLAVIHQNRNGQIRGTAGVEQLANIVIKLFRDKEHEDDFIRNTVKVIVQKNRFCGRTGPCAYLRYDAETNRLVELDKQAIEDYEKNGKPEEVW